MNEILINLIGTDNWQEFSVGLFFLFVGIALSLLLDANKRNINSSRTPIHFSYRFLFSDNVRRLFLSVILSLILYRFSGIVLPGTDTMFTAFVIGFSFDKISQFFKDKFKILKN